MSSYNPQFEWWMKYLIDPTQITDPKPRVYSIDVTWKCNLNCPFCKYRALPPKEMTFDLFMQLVYKAIREHCGILLSGGGEPTVHPEFQRMVNFLDAIQPLGIGMLTNGVDTENLAYYCAKLLQKPNTWVRISLNDRLLTPDLEDLINQYPNQIGFLMTYTRDDLHSQQQAKHNLDLLYPKAVRYVTMRPSTLWEPIPAFQEKCIGRKFVRVFEPDGTEAFCHLARGLEGKPPATCWACCKFYKVHMDDLWRVNPFT